MKAELNLKYEVEGESKKKIVDTIQSMAILAFDLADSDSRIDYDLCNSAKEMSFLLDDIFGVLRVVRKYSAIGNKILNEVEGETVELLIEKLFALKSEYNIPELT